VIDTIHARLDPTELRVATGNHCRAASTIAKLGHLQRNGVELAGQFLGIASALAWQLTGASWQETGLAITSGAFDLFQGRYLAEPWSLAGLDHVSLPPVRPTGTWHPAITQLAAE